MNNVFDDMRAALTHARETMRAADNVADGLAEVLVGRLRHVRPSVLAKLKRELRDFDMNRKDWKL
jgi:hypothetical protein